MPPKREFQKIVTTSFHIMPRQILSEEMVEEPKTEKDVLLRLPSQPLSYFRPTSAEQLVMGAIKREASY
jgi:hypothetical protein